MTTSIPASSSEVDLDALFEASLAGYRNRSGNGSGLKKQKKNEARREFDADEDVISLGNEEEETSGGKRKRQSQPSSSHLSTSTSTTPTTSRLDNAQITRHLDTLEQPVSPPGSTHPKAKRSTATASTAGSKWFDMPAFPSATSEGGKTGHGDSSGRYASGSSSRGPTSDEMRREVQAIRLRNALDPKRFYKGGGGKSGKGDKGMPQFAQLGKIIGSSLEPNNTLTRAERGNTVIEELVKDAQTSAYAKRKFAEHQHKTSAGGKGHYKAKSKKPSDRKRARK